MSGSSQIARVIPTVAALWLGMLIGVSFIATPIKFQAAGLALPVALDIGRLTFGIFSRVEWLMAVLLVIATLVSRPAPWRRIVIAAVLLGLAVQAIWLLPELNARVGVIMSARIAEPSLHHFLYAGIEAAKAVGLVALCVPVRIKEEERLPSRPDHEWHFDAMQDHG